MGVVGQQCPKCMLEIGGSTILQSQIRELRRQGFCDIHIVLGYMQEVVAPYAIHAGLTVHFNHRYKQTGMLESLIAAPEALDGEILVLYSDIYMNEGALAEATDAQGDIVLGADISSVAGIRSRREPFEDVGGDHRRKGITRLHVSAGRVSAIWKESGEERTPVSSSNPVYTGIFKLSEDGSRLVLARVKRLLLGHTIKSYPSPSYVFTELVREGIEIRTFNVPTELYAECDYVDDLESARARILSSER